MTEKQVQAQYDAYRDFVEAAVRWQRKVQPQAKASDYEAYLQAERREMSQEEVGSDGYFLEMADVIWVGAILSGIWSREGKYNTATALYEEMKQMYRRVVCKNALSAVRIANYKKIINAREVAEATARRIAMMHGYENARVVEIEKLEGDDGRVPEYVVLADDMRDSETPQFNKVMKPASWVSSKDIYKTLK